MRIFRFGVCKNPGICRQKGTGATKTNRKPVSCGLPDRKLFLQTESIRNDTDPCYSGGAMSVFTAHPDATPCVDCHLLPAS